jgi:transcriptional regulator with PAS, ATPase and Fis domain
VGALRRIHPKTRNLKETMRKVEKEFIEEVLARHKGNRTRAAKTLGISRQSLHSKLARHKIPTRSMSP